LSTPETVVEFGDSRQCGQAITQQESVASASVAYFYATADAATALAASCGTPKASGNDFYHLFFLNFSPQRRCD